MNDKCMMLFVRLRPLANRDNTQYSTERMIFKNVIERLKFIILTLGPQNNIRMSNHETIMA